MLNCIIKMPFFEQGKYLNGEPACSVYQYIVCIVFSCAVSPVFAVPELRMGVNGAVPSSLRVHRDVPHGAERQHVGPCVQHFPFQLPTTKG